MRSRDEVAR
uniref:Uncharacterized protein n=1 Tax=Arundo donax TaxID=35708 RepID=A0A0A9BQL9_ARUDO